MRANLIAKLELCTKTYNWAKEKLKGIRGEFDQETFTHYSYKLDPVYSEVSKLIKSKLMANLDLGLALKVVDKLSGDKNMTEYLKTYHNRRQIRCHNRTRELASINSR